MVTSAKNKDEIFFLHFLILLIGDMSVHGFSFIRLVDESLNQRTNIHKKLLRNRVKNIGIPGPLSGYLSTYKYIKRKQITCFLKKRSII